MSKLDAIADELREEVAGLDPVAIPGAEAARLTEVTAAIERLASTAKVLLARQAVHTNGWRRRSQAASPEQWFAKVSGCSEWVAREALATADRLDDLPATEEKLRDGSLSLAQAGLVSAAASIDPGAEQDLLRVAHRDTYRGLRNAKDRVVAAAVDMDAAHEVAVRERHLRTHLRGAATYGTFSGPTEEVAKLLRTIEPLEREAFNAARTTGDRDHPDVYRFDALIALTERVATGSGVKASRSARARTITRVRVDLSRLLHDVNNAGSGDGKFCEIPGVGPIPASVARRQLPHGLLELVITDGVDVQTVVSPTRHIPTALLVAIDERDQACKIDGCDRTEHLENHHTDEFAKHKTTSYGIVGKLCRIHHDLVTHHGYTIEPNPDGSWTLRAPPNEAAA